MQRSKAKLVARLKELKEKENNSLPRWKKLYPTAEDVPEISRLTEDTQKRGVPQTDRIQYWES